MVKAVESRDSMAKKSIRLRGKNQVTIPSDLIDELHLSEGEQLEVTIENGRIVLVPVMTIEKDQAWFWTKEWQQEERQAEKDLKTGQTSGPMTAEEAIQWLNEDE